MASADARASVDHTGFYRGILMIAIVAVPAFSLVAWEETYDPFAPRAGFAGAALAVLLASFWSQPVRRYLRFVLLLLTHALFLWFSYLAYRGGMTLEHIVGIVPVVAGAAVLVRSTWEVCRLVGFLTVVLVVAYHQLAAPAVDFSVPFAVYVTFAGMLGWMSVWRTRLEEALQVANATLERRVAERTELLEREVADRVAAEQRSNAASEAKSRFLANMSHELRTPLNAVIGYTELVQQELAESDQAHHNDDLDKVGRAARHLLTIIDNILDLSRVEAGSLALRSEPVDVSAAVDDAAVLVQPAIDARRNRLTVAVAPGLRVLGDREAFVRVLVHLLDNAAKFTTDGEIGVTAVRVGDDVEIGVRDTGAGIPAAALYRIFQRFTQADDSSTRLHGGVGLGLALCKELVARMRGSVAVDSAVGRGSLFTVRLPAA